MKQTNHEWKSKKHGLGISKIEILILKLINDNGGSIDAEDIRAELCEHCPRRQALTNLDRMEQRGALLFDIKNKTYSVPQKIFRSENHELYNRYYQDASG